MGGLERALDMQEVLISVEGGNSCLFCKAPEQRTLMVEWKTSKLSAIGCEAIGIKCCYSLHDFAPESASSKVRLIYCCNFKA